MANPPAKSVIVVGGGIVGLCIAVAAQAHGHTVTVIARDRPAETASGVAAGMIAPALEAMNDADPALSFQRLTAAQSAWFDAALNWPPALRHLLSSHHGAPSYFLFPAGSDYPALRATGAGLAAMVDAERGFYHLPAGQDAVRVAGDWVLPAHAVLACLADAFTAAGGEMREGEVGTVTPSRVRLRRGGWSEGDEVIVAAGYATAGLRQQVPSLKTLAPIKGHLLDLPAHDGWRGVLRGDEGYLACVPGVSKFGATMQAGQDDLRVEADVVAGLKMRAGAMLPGLNLDDAVARVGVRAASPDGWPMIGRDAASGVLVATAMRRNGYVFAPLAARMMLDFLKDEIPPEAAQYDPNRFS